jgi:3-hydroxybutyryl-CoA dehydrogenase
MTEIGVVGCGVMGRGIAQLAAQAGFRVWLFDAQPGSADSARSALLAQWANMQEKGKLSAAQTAACGVALCVASDLAELAGCDIVIEAIIEQLDAKRDLFAALEALVRSDCILASNTSSLAVTAIAAGCKLPARVAGLHFFNPVPLMKVAEVISGALTAETVAQQLCEFTARLGHRAVRARDTPGFIVNHAGRGFVTEALCIVQECVADFATIDTILVEGAGFRLGPFQLLDLTGLDVSHPVMESIYRQYYDEPRYRPSLITRQRLTAGLLGRKSGRGFYAYEQAGSAAPAPAPERNVPAAHPHAADLPAVWIGPCLYAARMQLTALLTRCGAQIDHGNDNTPDAQSLCLLAPLGEDVSSGVDRHALDPARTLGIDTLMGCAGHLTLMKNPATSNASATQAMALLANSGQGVSLIEDSHGFVIQRVLALIINIACDMVQQGICRAPDLDAAVTLGLAYPHGPLAWGDALGPRRILTILQNLSQSTGDPRYRPSPWLTRRAQLGLSLLHTSNPA